MREAQTMSRRWPIVSALLGGSGVMLGAFGSHGLRHLVDQSSLAIWRTAVEYQMFHAIALLALSLHAQRFASRRWAARLWLVGILLFSGSLYALVLSGIRPLGMVTPLGGLSFIAGWASLIYAEWRVPRRETQP